MSDDKYGMVTQKEKRKMGWDEWREIGETVMEERANDQRYS